jgi:Ca2+/Na+ antiporter
MWVKTVFFILQTHFLVQTEFLEILLTYWTYMLYLFFSYEKNCNIVIKFNLYSLSAVTITERRPVSDTRKCRALAQRQED